MSTFFVTGASGFIGLATTKRLRELYPESKIFALVRHQEAAKRLEALGATPLLGTLENVEYFASELKNSDYVFHIGGDARFGDAADYDSANVEPTRQILKCLSDSKTLKRFIFTSSIGAVDRSPCDRCERPLTSSDTPNPVSRYGKSKLACERFIQESGLPFTIIRPSWVYGRGMRLNSHIAVLLDQCIKKEAFTGFGFPGRFSVVNIKDLVEALARLPEETNTLNRIYFADDGNPQSLEHIFALGRKLSGHSAPIAIPHLVSKTLRTMRRFIPFKLRCLFEDVLVSQTTLFSDLGLHNLTPFEHGIADTLDFILDTKHNAVHIITGAASGIGKAFAESLSRDRARVILVDQSPEVHEVARILGQRAEQLDLSRREDIEQVGSSLLPHEFISGLTNCAGIGYRGEFIGHSPEQIERILAVNMEAPALLIRRFLPDMLRRKNVYIINVASSISSVPLPYMSIYGASKAALLSLGKSLWAELVGSGVAVLTVLPSGTRTAFQGSAGVRVLNGGKGLLNPDHVVQGAMKALRRGAPLVRIGFSGRFFAFLGRILPARLEILLWKVMMKRAR